ncbi:nicotinamide riboside transporter PnuC [Catalinimonas sp. 4WD22]|uniref:nicotinamide riboside transporter PnuC n=1 Tax=Catalinimonas locisalis TaxID=3133978 RepID=UPI00310118E1
MEINYIELLALVFGVLSVWFNTRELVWGWPTGIVGTVLSGIIFLEARLYSDLILHIFYVILGFYGWYEWLYGGRRSGGRNKQELKVSTLSKSRLLFLMLLGGLGWAGFGYFFDNYTDADLAYWDAFTTSFSFIGTYMLARKRIENWILWIVVDAVAAGIYMYKELFLLSLLYFLYLGLATYGFINWRKSMYKEQTA